MEKKDSIRSIIWNTLGMGLSSSISLILLIIVTRYNGIENSGLFSFLFSLCLIIYTITLYGGRVYQVSDYDNEYKYNTYYSLKIITSLVSIIILCGYLIIYGYPLIQIAMALLLLIVKVFDAFSDTIYGTFQKNNRLDLVGKSLTLKTVISVLMFILTDLLIGDLFLSVLIYTVINVLVFFIYDKKYEKHFEKVTIMIDKKIINLIFSTKYIFLNNFITNVLINVPRFFVKSTYDDKELGYFGILIMIPTVLSLCGQFIVQPMMISLTDAYSKREKNRLDKCVNKCYVYILLISVICILAAYFLGPQVLKLLYNIDFGNYKMAMIYLIIGGTFNVLSYVISTTLNIFRKTLAQTIIYCSTFIISIVLFYIFTINFAIEMVFIVFAIVMLIQFIMLYVYYRIIERNLFKEVK
jgi:O-antigen/teichoic acid export membrane protein